MRQGQISIRNRPGHLQIRQTSQRAVIDWQSFSIDRGDLTQFIQPGASAAVLNRVRGDSATQIEGMLRANGRVYLINPNGILIGPNGSVDVAGFVASTLDPGDRAFLRGRSMRFTGASDAAVVNLGSISAFDGDVVLMGASAANVGSIRAPRGNAALTAGNDILLADSGEERVFVRGTGGSKKAEGVTNTGEIEANIAELKAHGGNVYGIAVKNEGRVAATGISRRGGQIFLSAGGGKIRTTGTLQAKRTDGSGGRIRVDSGTGGTTGVGGTIDASGDASGGEITLLGREIEVFPETLILNDGATSGGITRVGGGERGEDPHFANADNLVVGHGTLFSASARTLGNGGRVILFADGSLTFDGQIAARGGALGGNGGFVELSGKNSVTLDRLTGRIDLSAAQGTPGTLLYDPINVAILGGNPGGDIASSPASQNVLYAGDISDFLTSTGSLIVTTASAGSDAGNLFMDSSATIMWATANNLSFYADNDFLMDSDATIIATGAGSFHATAARSIHLALGASITTADGDIGLSANQQSTPTPGDFVGIDLDGASLSVTGAGTMRLSGRGGSGTVGQHGIRIGGGTVISSTDSLSNADGIELIGHGGPGSSDSVGIHISNTDTILSSARRSIRVEGTGGGDSYGQRNRGILFTGGLIQVASDGNVSLFGEGGAGFNEIDGIQLDNGARIQMTDGEMALDGYAGGSLGIGVMLGNYTGDLAVLGSGLAKVKGTGNNANGVSLGNPSALLGGANASLVDVASRGGPVTVQRELLAAGNVVVQADPGDVLVQGEVSSGIGNIFITGNNLHIGAPITANYGGINLIFNGVATVNALPIAGDRVRYWGSPGLGDHLTFAGYMGSEIDLDMADLIAIEQVTGTGSPEDLLRGPATAANYRFTGPNAFRVGATAFSQFENVLGGGGHDVFAFVGSATLDGNLDGGGGFNTLDYSDYGSAISLDLTSGFAPDTAPGIGGDIGNVTSFVGSGATDTVTGPTAESTYVFKGLDAMQVAGISVRGFENLIAGPLADRFVFLPGSRWRGFLTADSIPSSADNLLDYSLYGGPVFVNLTTSTASTLPGGFSGLTRFRGSRSNLDHWVGPEAATRYRIDGPDRFNTPDFQVTGFESLRGGPGSDTFAFEPGGSLRGRLSGGDGLADTLDYSAFGRAVTVNIGPNTASGIGRKFNEIERILGSAGVDQFRFLDQTTIAWVDGGPGADLIEIDDSNLPGDHTYQLSANRVSRNPRYRFNNFEALRLYLGPGNNTVNSDFFSYAQFLHGGTGYNTLNLPGVTSLNQANPIGNVHHFRFDAPRPGESDSGDLLQTEVNQVGSGPDLNTGQNFQTENRFNTASPNPLQSPLAALGGAFSAALAGQAAIAAQAVIASVDGNSYLVLRPFSLDGSGLNPSNLGLAALRENLGVEANLELAAAIGFDGPIFLFNPDGPYAIDLSGAPVDPALLTLLQESLSVAAAAELSGAIGVTMTLSITGVDGIVSIALDGSPSPANVVALFADSLGDAAQAELDAAIAGGNGN